MCAISKLNNELYYDLKKKVKFIKRQKEATAYGNTSAIGIKER